MRRMRTRLFLAAAACFVLSLPARAQVAPTLSGETGLFEITNADMLAAGRFSFGLSWSMWTPIAAPVPGAGTLADDPLRYDLQRIGGSVGYGLMDRWEIVVGTGTNRYHAESNDWEGVIGGHPRSGGFTHTRDGQGADRDEDPPEPARTRARRALRRNRVPDAVQERRKRSRNVPQRLRLRRLVLRSAGSRSRRRYLLTGKLGTTRRRPAADTPATTSRTSGRTRSASPSRSSRTSSRRSARSTASTSTAATRSPSTTPRRSSAAASRSATSRRPAPSASNIDRWAKYGSSPGEHRRPRPVRVRARGPAAGEGPRSHRCARSLRRPPDRAGPGRPSRAGARRGPRARPVRARRRDGSGRAPGDLDDRRDPLRRRPRAGSRTSRRRSWTASPCA